MLSSHPDLDDESLINGCLAGNEEAWEHLLNRYSRLIYTIPLRFGFGESVADEVFQEVCLILLEKLESLREREQFKPWLVTITRRACLQRLRNQKSQVDLEAIEHIELVDESPEHVLLLLEQQELIYRAFATLEERCQQLLSALFMEQAVPPYEVLAETLQLSVGSIGPIRSRCLDRLRQALLKLDP